jgi:hypothetical protein
VVYATGSIFVAPTATTYTANSVVSDKMFLAKGDTCSFRITNNSGSSKSLLTSTGSNFFSIAKVSI